LATTNDWLAARDGVRIALTLVFEGVDLMVTTADNTSEMLTAYSGYDWTVCKNGLIASGNVDESIELFDPQINPSTMTFDVVDYDGTAIDTMLRPQNGDANTTILATNLDQDDTTASLKDASSLASSGTVYCGLEAIGYSGKSSNDLTGLTRGKFTYYKRNGGGSLGHVHKAEDHDVRNRATAPRVSDKPMHWYSRRVILFLHHYEDGAWSTAANSKVIWSGNINRIDDKSDGAISLSCISSVNELEGDVFVNPYLGNLDFGADFTDDDTREARLVIKDSGNSIDYDETFTWGSAGSYTASEIASALNAYFDSEFAATSLTFGSISVRIWIDIIGTGEGSKTRLNVSYSSGSIDPESFWIRVFVGAKAGHVCGLVDTRMNTDDTVFGGDGTSSGGVRPVSSSQVEVISRYALSQYFYTLNTLDKINVEDSIGTFETQSDIPAPFNSSAGITSGSDGFLLVNGNVYSVEEDSTDKFTIRSVFANGKFGIYSPEQYTYAEGDGFNGPPTVRQVFVYRGSFGDLFLRIMLSTGITSHNDSTYDNLPEQLGLSLPYDLIDVDSFAAIDEEFEIFLDGPRSAADILLPALAATNRHLFLKDGKLFLSNPGFDANVGDLDTVDEETKADPNDVVSVSYNPDGIINRVTVTERKVYLGSGEISPNGEIRTSSESKPTVNVEATASVTDYGKRRTVELKTEGFLDIDSTIESVISPALAYFSRPAAHLSRSMNYKLASKVPGDVVLFTDAKMISPVTGERGVSGLAAWVKRVSFDWTTGRGEIELIVLPDHPASRYGTLAPSALVDKDYNAGAYLNGYDTAAKKLRCEASYFQAAGNSSNDVSHFDVGDKIRIIEIDPSNTASPTAFTDTVAAVDAVNNDITLTTGLTGWASPGSADLEYVVEFDDINTVQSSQRSSVFMASPSTFETGLSGAGEDAYLYAGASNAYTILPLTAPVYTRKFAKFADTYNDQGEPLSAHKWRMLVDAANCVLAYKSRMSVSLGEGYYDDGAYAMSYCSRIPVYGLSRDGYVRDLDITAQGFKSGGAAANGVIRVTLSENEPKITYGGAGSDTVSFKGKYNQYDTGQVFTSTTTLTTHTISDCTPVGVTAKTPYVWLTIEAKDCNIENVMVSEVDL
jgi:hypothetical protein